MLKPEINRALSELFDTAEQAYIRWPKAFDAPVEVRFKYRGSDWTWIAGASVEELVHLKKSVCLCLRDEQSPYVAMVLSAWIDDTYHHHFGITE